MHEETIRESTECLGSLPEGGLIGGLVSMQPREILSREEEGAKHYTRVVVLSEGKSSFDTGPKLCSLLSCFSAIRYHGMSEQENQGSEDLRRAHVSVSSS
jgi:hypothetical protein